MQEIYAEHARPPTYFNRASVAHAPNTQNALCSFSVRCVSKGVEGATWRERTITAGVCREGPFGESFPVRKIIVSLGELLKTVFRGLEKMCETCRKNM